MSSPRASSSAHTLEEDEYDAEYAGTTEHVLILYASETGNSQDVAERLGREIRRRGGRCVLQSMHTFNVIELIHVPLVVFITSTHGNGDPPPSMTALWSALLRKGLPEDILEDVHFALYGLGDSSYDRFAYAAKLLHRRLRDLGANPINEPAYGDERAPDGIEETLLPWMKDTVDLILPHLDPPAHGFVEGATHELPEPIFRIDREGVNGASASSLTLNGLTLDEAGASNVVEGITATVAPVRGEDTEHGADGVYKPSDWGWAVVRRNQRVTRADWWQDVREVELELENPSTTYAPASIADLQPASLPEEVDDFLSSQDLLDIADIPLRISSAISHQPLPSHLPPSGHGTTLRSLLTYHLDLRGSPRKSFFEWLRRLSTDEREQERLDEFITDTDEIHDYATRPSRTIVETLADFRYTRIPLSHILEILPPLRRRQFSIASSYDSHPGKVQLLVAMVEYKTNLKAPRRGLCSSWLQSLPIGSRIPIHISPPTLGLPPNPDTPVLLVGPGTGVAPMRALMEERVRQGAAKQTRLYFGCRSLQADCYYADEWAEMRGAGAEVRIAASRDSKDKVYVQDLIRADAALVREWIEEREGWLFICGSSNAMPRAVREAVAWCLSIEGGGRMEAGVAGEYVERMFEEGRGGEESW